METQVVAYSTVIVAGFVAFIWWLAKRQITQRDAKQDARDRQQAEQHAALLAGMKELGERMTAMEKGFSESISALRSIVFRDYATNERVGKLEDRVDENRDRIAEVANRVAGKPC